MNPFTLNRIREKLSETIHANHHAGTNGVKWVYQREDGAVLSSRTGWFTLDLSDDPLEAHPKADPVFFAKPVPVEQARENLGRILKQAQDVLQANTSESPAT